MSTPPQQGERASLTWTILEPIAVGALLGPLLAMGLIWVVLLYGPDVARRHWRKN